MRNQLTLRHIFPKIIIMSIAGFFVIITTRSYTPAVTVPIPQQTEYASEAILEKSPVFLTQLTNRWSHTLSVISDKVKLHNEPEVYKPSVLSYNLMHHFPDAIENFENKSFYTFINNPSELAGMILKPLYERLQLPFRDRARNSYGAKMYEFLNKKDVEWTSGLYQWVQAEPITAARMKSLSSLAVTGSYNPANPKHQVADPSTWLIPSWKNIDIRFYDGNGKQIELYSNAQEILSMASVHTYFTDWKDTSAFQNYIDSLWAASHSYSVIIGSVYYCDGCVLSPEDMPATESENPSLIAESAEASESAVIGDTVPSVAISSINSLKAEETAPGESEGVLKDDKLSGPAEETVASGIQTNEGPATISQPTEDTVLSLTDAAQPEVTIEPILSLNSEGKFCPGHVDLTIQAQILDITGNKNLFTADKASNQLWTPYRTAYVRQLNEQDWDKEYHLSRIQLGIGTPLTSVEIENYLDLLPEDISQERRAVITYALNSVGKIPYYYGGKPKAPGYEQNQFSSMVLPDQKGRVLSGLDCSGWINWIYWSAIDKKLKPLGTSGLIHEGRAIDRSALKPGDILVKPGIDSHVVMFLSWKPDGSMICIHETGSRINNVTVSTLNSTWPYYRAILD